MTNADGAFLSLHNVGKRYGEASVVENFNLAIGKNEFITLLGPSGCGKTTTLRMIAGFVQPSSGQISLAGRSLSSAAGHVAPEHRNIGMVFQSYAVWPHMTVRQNVELPLQLRKVPAREAKRRVAEVLDLCRLGKLADRSPHQLSGGQLQRVALARALVYRPPLVLLDEPLSNLDVALREELRQELHHLHKAIESTFILVTHDQVEAMSLSDRVVVMRDGHIEQTGSPADIYRAPATDFVAQFVGSANVVRGAVEAMEAGEHPRFRVRVGSLVFSVRAWPGARVGTTVSLAIHPEAIQLTRTSPAVPGPNMFPARVKVASFLGRTLETVIQVDETELRAVQLRSSDRLEEGDCVTVCLSPDAIIPIGAGEFEPEPLPHVQPRYMTH